MIEIDYRLLNPDTLDNLLAEISLRKSGDYGEIEVPLVERKQRLLKQLELGSAVIMYFSDEGFCDLVNRSN